jgi:hypothetical protein
MVRRKEGQVLPRALAEAALLHLNVSDSASAADHPGLPQHQRGSLSGGPILGHTETPA